jgi:cytochrome c
MRTQATPLPPRFWLLAALCLLTGCERRAERVPGPDFERGRRLMAQYQCGSCHTVPAVFAAQGRVGPPLADFGRRSYIAGELPNTQAQLERWLQDPVAALPGTTMPDLGVSPADARDMAGYLLSLR